MYVQADGEVPGASRSDDAGGIRSWLRMRCPELVVAGLLAILI